MPILQEFMDPEDIQIITDLPINQVYKLDRLIWHHTNSRRYTVKSDYRLVHGMTETVEWGPSCKALKAQACKIRALPKLKHFLWQIASGSVVVTTKLSHRGIQCDIICQRCVMAVETINHALFECPHSRQTWEFSLILIIPGRFPLSSTYSNLDYLFWEIPSPLDGREKTHCLA